ncbi:MAG: hypothetical protein ABUS79_17005 [Pseudomonadota bacterium]
MGLTTDDTTDPHNGLAAAYALCFQGTSWADSVADPSVFCAGLHNETGSKALAGPQAGAEKSALCQALLKCIHRTNCPGATQSNAQCYCGPGVDLQTCEALDFTPMGQCADEIAAALEVSVFMTSANYFNDLCLANGAAFDVYLFCDQGCCSNECLHMSPDASADTSYCNAPGVAGAPGVGGARGTGGVSGTGGAGTGGVKGTAGVPGGAGTGGAKATGGMSGTGGTASGGSTGAAGARATGGSSGGTTGAGGGAGAVSSSGGSGGTGVGGSVTPGGSLQNGQFDANTSGWTAEYGVAFSRVTTDAAGNAQSGSLDVILSRGDVSQVAQGGASQCVTVTPGASVHLQAQIMVPASAVGMVNLIFYASGNCSGQQTRTFSSPGSANHSWQLIQASATAPAATQSMLVELAVLKPAGQGSAEALFDAVSVTSP